MNSDLKEELQSQLESDVKRLRQKGKEELASELERKKVENLLRGDDKAKLVEDYPESKESIEGIFNGLNAIQNITLSSGDGAESEIEMFLGVGGSTSVRLSGLLSGDTYFHTVFLEKSGDTHPHVLTSEGDMIEIRYRADEIDDDALANKSAYDYHYFDFEGDEIRLEQEPMDLSRKLSMHTPDNHVLEYLEGAEPRKQVFDDIEEQLRRFWDHYDDQWYPVLAAWVVHTYLLDGIGFTTYLMLNGRQNTGKSTLQKVLAKLSYRGCFFGQNTSALTSRVAHFNQATMHLDEFDKAANEKIQGVFNNGQSKGGNYNLTNMNRDSIEDQVTSLNCFCAKTLSVNGLGEFDKHLLSRCIIINATRAKRETDDIETVSDEGTETFQNLRNESLAYALFNHRQILDSVEDFKSKTDEKGREADKLASICGILHHFRSEEEAEEAADFLRNKERMEEDDINNTKKVLLRRLVSRFSDPSETVKVSPSDLKKEVNKKLSRGEEFELSAQGVGRRLRELDILRKESQSSRSNSDGSYRYTIPGAYLEDSLERYGYTELLAELKSSDTETSEGSVDSVASVVEVVKSIYEEQEEPATFPQILEECEYEAERLNTLVEMARADGAIFEPKPGDFKPL